MLANTMRPAALLMRASRTVESRSHVSHIRSASTQSGAPLDAVNGYDVVVVGGGHAGSEAAAGAARTGARTLLLTHKISTIGEMSCNPSFGGIGKGTLIREIDALDGVCGKVCDAAGVQFRVLNMSRGPAVWGPRAQIDRDLYREHMQRTLLSYPNLTVHAMGVEDLVLHDGMPLSGDARPGVSGVKLADGTTVPCKAVIITTGTFLRGQIHIGLKAIPAGRIGDEPAIGLSKTLERFGFELGRLKTGTPPRLDGRTINYSGLEVQLGDEVPTPFSYMNSRVANQDKQLACHMTHTTPEFHQIVRDNLHQNRHVTQDVRGPRYCPSIESKVLRFKRATHQVWLEPEGYNSHVVYPNGISMTMPEEAQFKAIRTMKGLENVTMLRSGYGVEYDYVDPRQLHPSLETKKIGGLFLAGQINGTTGYEEAASQGILAGINAALAVKGAPPLVLDRADGYLGVLVDDLITHGATEPYRMFTARAEYRFTMRADNADFRLTPKGIAVGCVSKERIDTFESKLSKYEAAKSMLKNNRCSPKEWTERLGTVVIGDGPGMRSGWDMLGFQTVTIDMLFGKFPDLSLLPRDILAGLAIDGKYAALIDQQERQVAEYRRDAGIRLPEDIDYTKMAFLPMEAREKLSRARPHTLGAASTIAGVTPTALMILLHHVKRGNYATMGQI
eukprot:Opistho-2@41998